MILYGSFETIKVLKIIILRRFWNLWYSEDFKNHIS